METAPADAFEQDIRTELAKIGKALVSLRQHEPGRYVPIVLKLVCSETLGPSVHSSDGDKGSVVPDSSNSEIDMSSEDSGNSVCAQQPALNDLFAGRRIPKK